MRAAGALMILLAVAPVLLVTAWSFLGPEPSPETPTLWSTLHTMGLSLGPVWMTYLPALILLPLGLNHLSRLKAFRALSLPVFILCAFFAGALGGIYSLSPLLFKAGLELTSLLVRLALSGALAGGFSLVAICLVYRFWPENA